MAELNGPFGDSIPTVRGSAAAMDVPYITAQLSKVYAVLGVAPTGPGSGPTDIAYYTQQVRNTGGWFNDGTETGNNAGYWNGRITRDYNAATGGNDGTPGPVPKGGGANGALVNRAARLLEDDIVYRLGLACGQRPAAAQGRVS
jgi:hypothetical protein